MISKKTQDYITRYTKENYCQVCARFRKDSMDDMKIYDFIKEYGVVDFMRDGYAVLKQLQEQRGALKERGIENGK